MKTKFVNKKAIIFDLDGTLADTISAIAEAVNLTMEAFGYPTQDEITVKNAVGNGATTLIKRLVPKDVAGNDEAVLQVRKVYDEMYAKTYMHTVDTYEGIKQAVRSLKNDKNLKIAVLSNKQDAYVKALCKQYFPDDTISMALGQTDLPIKPNIAGLEKILKELGVTVEESIFSGDSEVDVQTAKNADMDFIGVAWGFVGKERLINSGAQTVIDHPNQFADIIL